MREYENSPLNTDARSRLYRRLLLRGVVLVISAVALIAGLPRLLPLVMPFVIALVAAMILNPFVNALERRFRIPRRVSAFVLTFFVVGALFLLCGWLINTLIIESISLAANINSIWGYVVNSAQYLSDKLDWLVNLSPIGSESALDIVTENIHVWLQSASKGIMDSALVLAGNITSKVSSILVASIMALLAVYFTIADYAKLSDFMRNHTERHIFEFLQKIKKAVQSALGGYLKAQLLLALLAFAVMFAGLALYGQRYALLIALGLGIVDFLPIVGTIAVLVPWAIIEFISGEVSKAIFLAILAVGFFLLRKMVEPKIVGSQTGLHPLAALASIYAGMKLSGVWGAILGPVVVMIVVNVFKSGIFDNTLADIKDLYHVGRDVLQRKRSE